MSETFIVGKGTEGIILGIPFPADSHCNITFGVPIVEIAGKKLRCTDRNEQCLINDVQVEKCVTVKLAS